MTREQTYVLSSLLWMISNLVTLVCTIIMMKRFWRIATNELINLYIMGIVVNTFGITLQSCCLLLYYTRGIMF